MQDGLGICQPDRVINRTLSPRNSGRSAFIARLATIKAEIARGDYLVDIHARHAAALKITYSAFRKLVQRYAEDAKPVSRKPYRSTSAPRPALIAPRTAPPSIARPTTGASHARHEPKPAGYIPHDGNPKEDDHDRLITGKRS